MNHSAKVNLKVFLLLLIAGMLSIVALFPYLMELQAALFKRLPVPPAVVLLLQLIQGGILLAGMIFAGLYLGREVGLGTPLLDKISAGEKRSVDWWAYCKVPVIMGVLAVGIIVGLDGIFGAFTDHPQGVIHNPAWWKGILASFYGGIAEEIQLRLFLMTVLVWIYAKFTGTLGKGPGPAGYWAGLSFAALIFGAGHLPTAASLLKLTPLLIARIVLLNACGGVIYGWLYWKRGLEAGMIAHFTSDILLHGLLPAFMP